MLQRFIGYSFILWQKTQNNNIEKGILAQKLLSSNFGTYTAISSTKETTHRTYWYILCLGSIELVVSPLGKFLWLIHPYWGRNKITKPARKPVINPPIWAKLSICGSMPSAKFDKMTVTRINKAANCTGKLEIYSHYVDDWMTDGNHMIEFEELYQAKCYLIIICCPICEELREHASK